MINISIIAISKFMLNSHCYKYLQNSDKTTYKIKNNHGYLINIIVNKQYYIKRIQFCYNKYQIC